MKKRMIIFILLLGLSLAVSGCSDRETSTVDHGEGDGEYEVTYTQGDTSNEGCPAGSTWTASNPVTGETLTMEIVGTEVIEGIEMCHAVYEAEEDEDADISRMDYYWSVENDEVFMWKAYDMNNELVSEMKAMDGKITITDA